MKDVETNENSMSPNVRALIVASALGGTGMGFWSHRKQEEATLSKNRGGLQKPPGRKTLDGS